MSQVLRTNRKASDADIIRLNSVGLSLATIAKILGVHPSSVTLRLKSLGIPPADTRRTFMEDVFKMLEPNEQEWFADTIQASGTSLKEFVRDLIKGEHLKQNPTKEPE